MDRVDSTQNGKPRFGIRQRNACTAGASLFGLLLGVSGCLGEGEAAGTPNTATETETETETAARPITTVTDMKGYTTTTFGSRMANRCALTVPVAFNAINNTANRIRYKSMGGKVLPPTSSELGVFDNWDEHIQGFSRIAMTGTDNHWAAVSRASHVVGTGGFFLINLVDVRGGDGTRWAPNGTSFTGEPPADRRTYLYYPMSSTDHPGGLSPTAACSPSRPMERAW